MARGAAGNCERSFGPTRPITQYSTLPMSEAIKTAAYAAGRLGLTLEGALKIIDFFIQIAIGVAQENSFRIRVSAHPASHV